MASLLTKDFSEMYEEQMFLLAKYDMLVLAVHEHGYYFADRYDVDIALS